MGKQVRITAIERDKQDEFLKLYVLAIIELARQQIAAKAGATEGGDTESPKQVAS